MKNAVLALLLMAGVTLFGADENIPAFVGGKPAKNLILGRGGEILCKSPDGKEVWKHKVGGLIHDLSVLPNGNILYANGERAAELSPDRKLVWEYKPTFGKGGGPYSIQRTSEGTTVIAENSTGTIMEFDAAGKLTDSFAAIKCKQGSHGNLRLTRKTPQGTYLVCHSGEHVVREYKKDGTVIDEMKLPNLAFKAERIANGNMMTVCLDKITEYGKDKKVVWEFKKSDLPDASIRNMTGYQILPNGNLLVGSYAPDGTPYFEITRAKKLVWRYSAPKEKTSVMGVAMPAK